MHVLERSGARCTSPYWAAKPMQEQFMFKKKKKNCTDSLSGSESGSDSPTPWRGYTFIWKIVIFQSSKGLFITFCIEIYAC